MNPIKNLTFYSSKLNADKHILVVSDLHLDNKRNGWKNLKKITTSSQIDYDNLDYICIPGDIVNDVNQLEDKHFKTEVLDGLWSLTKKKPTIVSLGNHDQMTDEPNGKWKIGNFQLLIDTLQELPNFTVLRNNQLPIQKEDLCFGSYSPHFLYYEGQHENKEMYRNGFYGNYQEFPEDTYNIFLTHEPQSIIYLSEEIGECIQKNADLVISGHMHNGLLPKALHPYFENRGILSPQMDFGPKFAQGEYKVGNTDFIINGPVNTRVETPILNAAYGPNASFVSLKTKVR